MKYYRRTSGLLIAALIALAGCDETGKLVDEFRSTSQAKLEVILQAAQDGVERKQATVEPSAAKVALDAQPDSEAWNLLVLHYEHAKDLRGFPAVKLPIAPQGLSTATNVAHMLEDSSDNVYVTGDLKSKRADFVQYNQFDYLAIIFTDSFMMPEIMGPKGFAPASLNKDPSLSNKFRSGKFRGRVVVFDMKANQPVFLASGPLEAENSEKIDYKYLMRSKFAGHGKKMSGKRALRVDFRLNMERSLWSTLGKAFPQGKFPNLSP